ncbi:MAG: hypothetical protein L6R30_14575 [Thermoanaerobaculia bacterium]|nr:hypothetical protein [Thermoanaerobaculia bacterium]
MKGILLSFLLVLLGLPASAGVNTLTTRVPSQYHPPHVDLWVLLPPSYASGRSFPLVTFLHDGQGDEEVLSRRGIADHLSLLMESGRLPEFILVAPRGTGTWFIDSFDGKSRFGSFLSEELIPFVDRTFRTVPDRSGRAVFGISMGGYGAMRLGLARPEMFSAIGGLSPALHQMVHRSFKRLPFFVRPSLFRVFGRSAEEETTRENDVYQILLSDPSLARRLPPVFLRCGVDDGYGLGEVAGFFRDFLTVLEVPNEVVVEPGTHDWPYWRAAVPRLLASIAGRFKDAELSLSAGSESARQSGR